MPLTTTIPKYVIFTDLDGTLLDRRTYSFEPALPALRLIRLKSIPLIFSSSKTRAEIELYRRRLENDHPFISENGGGVFIPRGYFPFGFPCHRELDRFLMIELGTSYLKIIDALESIKQETGISLKGFHDLTQKEIASFSGLSQQEVELAKTREYDEPFLIEGGEKEIGIVRKKIEEKGMNYAWGGKFHHILGKNDKGKAVEILKELYENQFSSIYTIGIGDNLNDLPMLRSVDHPILLKEREDGLRENLASIQNLTVVEGTGPGCWNEAILRVIDESGRGRAGGPLKKP